LPHEAVPFDAENFLFQKKLCAELDVTVVDGRLGYVTETMRYSTVAFGFDFLGRVP